MLTQTYKEVVAWLNIHPLVAGAALLVFALLASLVVDQVFKRIINRITAKTKTDLDDRIAQRIHRPMKATVFLLLASWSLRVIFDDHPALERPMDFVYSIILIWWIWTVVQATRLLFSTLSQQRRGEQGWAQMLPLLDNLATIVLVVVGGFWLLDLWEINITPLLASAGIVTAAVALAAKDTLANFFGGVSIFLDRPYRVGDFVVVDSGERGEVVDIGVRSTRVQTRDDVLVTIPNAVMANAKIVNETQPAPRYRVRCKVGVSYNSDPKEVEQALLDCIKDIPEILQFPNPRVRFRAFGDSALDFELLAWVRYPADRGRIVHRMNQNIFYAFKDAGIEIPFPQRVVHLAASGQSHPPAPLPDESEEPDSAGS